ncbi:dimethyladenosine transferase [Salinisphaera sp. PC39]|uniref:16S rRNA (adenine(1518)-N(6)/adenine(1519)-N(6))- dimethyltransferase RsmA n=1 Tax=Salinisphaera sp. PC39 TaxID=1304156 RepID=UPI00333E48C2
MKARKRFGQHFLHDPAVLGRIVDAVAPRPGDNLVEIGPGRGALTERLLERIGRLTAIEIDRDLVPALRARFGEALTVIEADALKADYAALAAAGPLRLVGNLPYNISSPLLFALLGGDAPVADMHFMLQKEVVDRIVATAGERDYGRLSAAVAARAEAEVLFTVGPGAFNPPPRVNSAVVRLRPRPAPFPLPDPAAYDRVVTAAFGQRRKTLRNALSGLLDADAIAAAGVDPGDRAERITPERFAALALRLSDVDSSGRGE